MSRIPAGTSLPDLRQYLFVVWRRKWILLLTMITITGAVTFIMLFLVTPQYEASTELLQRPSGLDRALLGSDLFGQAYSQRDRDISTAAKLVPSPQVAAEVEADLGSRLGGRDPLELIKVTADKKADILYITATDADAELASEVANSFATNYIEWRRNIDHDILQQARAPLEAQVNSIPPGTDDAQYAVLKEKLETLKLIETIQVGDLEIVKQASPAALPVFPKPMQSGTLALITSIVFGLGLIFLTDHLDTRVRNPEEVRDFTEKPILASIPKFAPGNNGHLITLTQPGSSWSEGYRLLKTNLDYAEPDRDIRSIMVTSPSSGDGKSTTISNLAVTLARSGSRVIILEADLRRPTLAGYLGISNSVGVTNVMAGNCSLREAMQTIEPQHLIIANQPVYQEPFTRNESDEVKPIRCCTAGPVPPNPGEMVSSRKFKNLIEEAGREADVVLVDAPPFELFGDASSLASAVDTTIIVVRMRDTHRKQLQSVNEFADSIPSSVVGLVITNAEQPKSYAYGYGYYGAH